MTTTPQPLVHHLPADADATTCGLRANTAQACSPCAGDVTCSACLQSKAHNELPVPIAGHFVSSHHPAFETGTVVRADAGAGQTAVYYRLGTVLVLEEGIRGGWLREYASEADVDAVVTWLASL